MDNVGAGRSPSLRKEAGALPPQSELHMDNGKTVILCVDDDDIPLLLRQLALRKAGYEVIAAKSGAEALRLLSSAAPRVDLVLSDYLMPKMDGVQLSKEIKALYPKMPVVLISGVTELPTSDVPLDAFVSKVEGLGILCEQIATLLKKQAL
jgi:CheY-like chemotaxis protein